MEASAKAWLDLVCRSISGVTGGVVVRPTDGPEWKLEAAWPRDVAPSADLLGAARAALDTDGPVLARVPESRLHHVAVPLPPALGVRAAAALTVEASHPRLASATSDRLRQAGDWLVALVQGEGAADRLGRMLRLVGAALERDTLRDAATAVATDLATQLDCERVSVGMLRRGRVRIAALSHSARFDERTELALDLAAAMEEATDQDAVVLHPAPDAERPLIVRAHSRLAEVHGAGVVLSVPLAAGGETLGALTLERRNGTAFAPAEVGFARDAAACVAPALAWPQRSELGVFERARAFARDEWTRLRGPGHARAKLTVLAVLATVVVLGFVHVPYRVKADAVLEGRVQRAVVAPVEGYIAEASARAGDIVVKGQTLGRLDDRDLAVEGGKWRARREELRVEYFEALASHDRTRINVLTAKIAQAEAQLALVQEQLGRTRLVAPFDGVVVQGDLSQSLGSPVARGDLLFEIAPLDGYRIILRVDERDVRDVAAGSAGRLTLSAMPAESLPFTVERITPGATTEDGRNFFRVEARLDHPPDSLRPGMGGVARVDADRRRIAWILSHDLVDWLRLLLWTWWP